MGKTETVLVFTLVGDVCCLTTSGHSGSHWVSFHLVDRKNMQADHWAGHAQLRMYFYFRFCPACKKWRLTTSGHSMLHFGFYLYDEMSHVHLTFDRTNFGMRCRVLDFLSWSPTLKIKRSSERKVDHFIRSERRLTH